MSKILIFNPVVQHSHRLAIALARDGHEVILWTAPPIYVLGSDAGKNAKKFLPRRLMRRVKVIENVGIVCKCTPIIKIGIIASNSLLRGELQMRARYLLFYIFDKIVAQSLEKLNPDYVIGFEDFSSQTFTMANKLGIPCFLDAPTFHHTVADKVLNRLPTNFRKIINSKKEQETRLAKNVICCSALASKTYISGGVPKNKVYDLILGASSPDSLTKASPRHIPLKFIFAGVLSKRKSIDIIFEAFSRLSALDYSYEIKFVGGVSTEDSESWIDIVNKIPNSSYSPSVSQKELYEMFLKADCLLLPSRYDAFGMVVAEAMACGIPAIVSNMTGSAEIIKRFPLSGWIIEPSTDSLINILIKIMSNPEIISNAKSNALIAASEFTWEKYELRAKSLYSTLFFENSNVNG